LRCLLLYLAQRAPRLPSANRRCLFFVTFAILGGLGPVIALALETEKPRRVVGGPCEYKQYKGKATIVSIRKKGASKKEGGSLERSPCHQRYEVKFSFSPDEQIEEPYAQVEGRHYPLMLTNGSYPGSEFLEKYGIEVGKTFDCYLKVMTKGSCTPVLFEFPGINRGERFESGR
jgi:hypothetical protein